MTIIESITQTMSQAINSASSSAQSAENNSVDTHGLIITGAIVAAAVFAFCGFASYKLRGEICSDSTRHEYVHQQNGGWAELVDGRDGQELVPVRSM